jgi:predicted TIM-barrel fold metal-dependent hydrolase
MILDTSTWVGHWPFQRLAPATPAALIRKLRAEGIDRAWTAAADAVLYPDPQQGNELWLPRIAKTEGLVPVAIIDPTLPNWPASLERCAHDWGARVVRLIPSYHRLNLNDPRVDELIRAAAAKKLVVSIQFRLEDERRHHPLMKVPPPAIADLLTLARRHPQTPFHVACAYLGEAVKLAAAPNLVLEISSLESLDTLAAVTTQIPAAQVCFGSYTPFYYTRAAVLKLQNTSLDAAVVDAISAGPAAWRGV